MDKESLLRRGTEVHPLWQLSMHDINEGQKEAREQAIAEKAAELAGRYERLTQTMGRIRSFLGAMDTREVRIVKDAETGNLYSADITENSSGLTYITYWETKPDSQRRVLPGVEWHSPWFSVEDTTAQELDVSDGKAVWNSETTEYSDDRHEILFEADGLITEWEATAQMLSVAMCDPELNPKLAEKLRPQQA